MINQSPKLELTNARHTKKISILNQIKPIPVSSEEETKEIRIL